MRPYQRVLCAWAVGIFVFGLWCSRLFTIPEYFERTLALGWYPPDADSIAIPIAGGGLLTFFAAPCWVLGLWLALRRFPPRVRLLAWSDDRIGSTLLWTVACAALCYFEVTDLISAVRLGLPLTATVAILWIAAWLLLRAILVSRERQAG